ncbi:MAG: YybH family protein, partial [Burkholderiales bacterium]
APSSARHNADVRHSDGHAPKESTLINAKNDAANEIAAAQRRFLRLFALNDLTGIAACYAEDAQMLVANMEVIVGRASIQSVFKFTAVPGHVLEFQTQELDIHGTTGIEIGSYIRKRRDGSIFDRGKYMVVWKLVAGTWLIHRDMFSTSLAKPVVLSAA